MLTIQASTCFTADSPVMLSLPPWYYCNLCAFSSGTSQGVEAVVRARVGGTAELGCSLTPLSTGVTTPNLFPLHVVEWVRLGYNVPILIKFGVYAPRVHPKYKGESSCPRSMSYHCFFQITQCIANTLWQLQLHNMAEHLNLLGLTLSPGAI